MLQQGFPGNKFLQSKSEQWQFLYFFEINSAKYIFGLVKRMKIIKLLQTFLVAILKQKSWFTNFEFFAGINFYGSAISGVNKKFNFAFWPKTAKIGSSEDKLHMQQHAQNTCINVRLLKFLKTILVLMKFAIKNFREVALKKRWIKLP